MDNPKRSSLIKAARSAIAPQLRTRVLWKSWWQIANSFVPFFATCGVMYACLDVSVWLTWGLSLLAAALLVRIFIIQHDCGHGAFFKSARANDWLGRICGVLTLTPYDYWRRQHQGHHVRWNCLDRRGPETDPWSKCLTVREYSAKSAFRRWLYRVKRHPVVMFLLLPPFLFLVLYRIPFAAKRERLRASLSVHITSGAVASIVVLIAIFLGLSSAALVQLPINILASIAGAWLFFVQHQFDRSNWVRKSEWEYGDAVMKSSSYLRLPAVLRWFSGNIGFHHIHHLDYRIPNYHLARCQRDYSFFRDARVISLWTGLKAARLALWDEERGSLVGFADVGARGRAGGR